MVNILFTVLIIFTMPAFGQNDTSKKWFVTTTKDGKERTEEVQLDDSTVQILQNLIQGNVLQPNKKKNDSLFDASGKLKLVILGDDFYGAAFKKFIYDEQDRLIKEVGLDREENIAPFYEYVAIREIYYDTKGREVEQRAFDKNRNYVEPCAIPPVVQTKYDSLGRISEVIYLNQQRELHQGFTRIVYRYNDEGHLVEKLNYNGKGAVIEKVKVGQD